jgi:sec-independent protein translocase protein TatC
MTAHPSDPAFTVDDGFDEANEEEFGGHARMSFLEHLDELRRRILYSLYAVGGCCLITFWFWEPAFRYLVRYFRSNGAGATLIFSTPTAGFMFSLKISLLGALVVASPFVFSQLWLFIAPGLYTREKKVVIPFVLCSTVLFLAGGAFAHFVAFPLMWQFFASYQLEGLQFFPTLDETFGFYVKMILGLGLVFQMPMLVFFLARFGIVTAGFLARNIKYAILAIFIIAAVVTPSSDVVNQTVFAAPMIVLYLISIVVAWAFGKKRPKIQDTGFPQ